MNARRSQKSVEIKPRSVIGPRPTGARVVYDALRQSIISMRLAPGEPLEELQLCRAYKVSRTPVREALIRLASEDLVELEPNRGAKVASMQFVDVVDHYEAMDIFQPVICHFAAVRRSKDDLADIESCLGEFRKALAQRDSEAIILANFNLHSAIAAACHNRALEKAYRRMLVDKLRVAQHGIRASSDERSGAIAQRFRQTLHISESLVGSIADANADAAANFAGDLNAYIRTQVIDLLSPGLGAKTRLRSNRLKALHASRRALDDGLKTKVDEGQAKKLLPTSRKSRSPRQQ
jgi:DNA-binding GntR family transcriptional regulator